MATYLELHTLRSDSDLQDRTAVAVVKKAQSLIDGATPTTTEITWALDALAAPVSAARSLLNYVLAANSSATPAQITGANDTALQTNVDAAVDAIIAGTA